MIRNEVENWVRLISDSSSGMFRLVRAELMLAATGVPQLLALWLLVVPLILLAWIGIGVLLAWFAWMLSAQVWLGILSFVVLQLLGCFALFRKISSVQREVLFPATRRQLQSAGGGYGDDRP